jgi:hypothetical protein
MTSPHYAKLAARFLTEGAEDAARSTPPSRGARDLAVAAIQRAILEKAKKKRRMRWIGWSAAAAVLLCAGGVGVAARMANAPSAPIAIVVRTMSGDVAVTSAGKVAVAEGDTLTAGSHVVARAGGRAQLALSTGTRVTVEEESELTVVGEGAQIFALDTGAVRAEVAKLKEGQRFVVRTEDAEIEVRGTSFRVATAPSDPGCGNGTTTRVAVYEGVVAVRRAGVEARVRAGETWPASCSAPRPLAPVATLEKTSPEPQVAATDLPIARPSKIERAVTPAEKASRLAEQNDRFAEAIAKKRSGNTAGAIASFERFLATYPQSPLAESATVERMKLLAASDPARGAAAARMYLMHYPRGFARAEAQAIVGDKATP